MPTKFRTAEVWLEGERITLTLRRCPLLLRFVVTPAGELDALDQINDVPADGEQVVAAVRVSMNPMHVKYGGRDKHRSGWRMMATYRRLAEQPPEDALRDTFAWQAWCFEYRDRESK